MTVVAIPLAAFLSRLELERAFGIVLAALFGLALLWILVSVLWPSKPDRTCPECGKPTLLRLDPRTTRGVACGSCGHEDAYQSAFLLAEDEDEPIEPSLLREWAGSPGRTR